MRDPVTTLNFEEFYERSAPYGAGELAALYRSVWYVSDQSLFETKEVEHEGKTKYHVISWSEDLLVLTTQSRLDFLRFLDSKNRDPDLDIEEAADCEYSVNKDNS